MSVHPSTVSKQKKNTVRVCIRIRPLLQHEDAEFWSIDESTNTIYTNNSLENRSDLLSDFNFISNQQNKDLKRALMDSIYSPQSFTFDKIYSIEANSQSIYKESCRDITKSVLNGFNCSVFMYGQTTSGKTFTMLGSPNSPGILPCSLRDVFSLISKELRPENYTVYCSYIEIYNENIHDLLTDANYLKLIDDFKYGVVVAGAKRVKINNFEDGIGIKDFGEENRKYRETLINEYSSRSHTIFQIFIESVELINQTENNEEYTKSRFSCLNLVDLAGSERINEYDPKAEGSGETGYINKSLFVLANVINRLAESKKNYVPYRDSKLTRLLSQALGGKSLTCIICTVSPAAVNYYQTLSTLRFGTRAKIVKLKPTPNEYLDDKGKLEVYKNEIRKLKNELKDKNKRNLVLPETNNVILHSSSQSTLQVLTNSMPNDQREMFDKIVKTNETLTNELENYKQLYLNERSKNEELRAQIEKYKQGIGNSNSTINNNKNYSNSKGNGLNLNYNYNTDDNDIINNTNNNERNMIQSNQGTIEKSQLQYTDESNKVKDQGKKIQTQPITPLLSSNSNSSFNGNKFREDLQRNLAERQLDSMIPIKKINPIPKKESNVNTESNKNNMTSPKSTHSLHSNKKELTLFTQDDIIEKINSKKIFETIELNHTIQSFANFEDNIKTLKETYENKVDALEKTMDYYKSYIESYYRKKIQETRNTNMDTVELIEDNLPIMQITSQHNDTLKRLREQYEAKTKELETTFFVTLRTITAKRMDNMSKE